MYGSGHLVRCRAAIAAVHFQTVCTAPADGDPRSSPPILPRQPGRPVLDVSCGWSRDLWLLWLASFTRPLRPRFAGAAASQSHTAFSRLSNIPRRGRTTFHSPFPLPGHLCCFHLLAMVNMLPRTFTRRLTGHRFWVLEHRPGSGVPG